MKYPHHRPRRLRQNPLMRDMVAETRLHPDQLVYPMFVVRGEGVREPVKAMPGIFHYAVDTLEKEVGRLLKLGLRRILLFGVEAQKDPQAGRAWNDQALVPIAIRRLRAAYGNALGIFTDVCVCAYTDHGHCGVLEGEQVDNDKTLDILAAMSLAHARAGADMVAPSDMMDGRVAAIRTHLDQAGYTQTGILSYAVKYASAYYGPFRDAAGSAPQKGDRKGYQMDARNLREAVKEAWMDQEEGADILMVKPALAYLDVIRAVRENTRLPLACYNVSGEYSIVKVAAEQGLVDEAQLVMENMHAFARAGADIIITYHAREMLEKEWLK